MDSEAAEMIDERMVDQADSSSRAPSASNLLLTAMLYFAAMLVLHVSELTSSRLAVGFCGLR